jgi:hypothetical protein
MARYELRAIGVYDNTAARHITRSDGMEWAAYRAWLLAGNEPDPMPAPVVVPPTQAEIDALAEIEARTAMRTALRADATIQYLRTHTPAEAATYASNAITDLASAKVVIGKLTMLVAYLARERLAAE